MKIEIEKHGDHYRADCKDLPGMPPVGVGNTPELALACLFWSMLFDTTGGSNPRSWVRFIKKEEPIVVNGKTWDYPQSYKDNPR